MKKIITLVLTMCMLFSATVLHTDATENIQTTTDAMAPEPIESDAYAQRLIEQYGSLQLVSDSCTYYVTEYYSSKSAEAASFATNSSNNEMRTVTYAFDSYPTEYINSIENTIELHYIAPGEEKLVDYSVIQVYLGAYAIANTTPQQYYVRSYFFWSELPDPGYFSNIDAACGVALASQLSIDGSSYEAQITYSKKRAPLADIVNQTDPLIISDIGVDAIGGTFSLVHQQGQGISDYLTKLSGYVKCVAGETNSSDNYCSAMACFSDASKETLSGFSISYPVGISFDVMTDVVEYNVQDSIELFHY